jgi:hypothetical protein
MATIAQVSTRDVQISGRDAARGRSIPEMARPLRSSMIGDIDRKQESLPPGFDWQRHLALLLNP